MLREIDNFLVRPGQFVGRAGLDRMLAAWVRSALHDQEEIVSASSVYIKPGEIQQYLQGQGKAGSEWLAALDPLGAALRESETGLAGLRLGRNGLAIVPPFPLRENRSEDKVDTGPLLSLLDSEYLVGLVLLRLGRFSVAVFKGRDLVSSKTDSRYVKGRHKAGGTSQKRFSRIREGQIHRIYDKACQVVEAQLSPHAGALDFITLGGESATLNGFLKECTFLQRHQGIIQDRRLNVRDPKRDSLEGAGEMLWECRVWQVSFGS